MHLAMISIVKRIKPNVTSWYAIKLQYVAGDVYECKLCEQDFNFWKLVDHMVTHIKEKGLMIFL